MYACCSTHRHVPRTTCHVPRPQLLQHADTRVCRKGVNFPAERSLGWAAQAAAATLKASAPVTRPEFEPQSTRDRLQHHTAAGRCGKSFPAKLCARSV